MTQLDPRDPDLPSIRRRSPVSGGGSRRTVVIVVAVLLVAAIAAGGFFVLRAQSGRGASASANANAAGVPATTPPAAALASATATASAAASASVGATGAADSQETSAGVPVPVADPATDQAVSVLMYHHIMPNPSNSIAISPATFDAQMSYLKRNGFHPVTIAQMNDFVLTGKRLPDKPVLITFDDGRMNQLTYGVPILRKYGFPATFFVVKKWIVTTSPSFMHDAELKQLVADGFDVQSHTANHVQIHPSKTSAGGIETYAKFRSRYWDPVAGYRTWLSDLTGQPVFALAYPGGRFNNQAEQLAGEAGYTLAFTVNSGYVTYQGGKNAVSLPRWNTGAKGTSAATFAYIVNRAAKAAKSK